MRRTARNDMAPEVVLSADLPRALTFGGIDEIGKPPAMLDNMLSYRLAACCKVSCRAGDLNG